MILLFKFSRRTKVCRFDIIIDLFSKSRFAIVSDQIDDIMRADDSDIDEDAEHV